MHARCETQGASAVVQGQSKAFLARLPRHCNAIRPLNGSGSARRPGVADDVIIRQYKKQRIENKRENIISFTNIMKGRMLM